MKRRIGRITTMRVLVFAVALLGLLGCNKNKNQENPVPAGVAGNTDDYEVLEIRYQGSANDVRVYELAEELGYLAPLKLKWIGNTISGPQDLQVTQTNETDIGGAFITAVINLKAAGGTLTSVIGFAGSTSKFYSALIVLEDSPIKGARDLIGKTVAVNTLAAASEVYVRSYLAKEGLTPEEIEKVELIIVPPVSTEQALRSKQVDSAMMSGILQDKIFETGGVRAVFRDIDVFGDFTNGVYCVREDFVKKNPKTTKKLVEATAKAFEWSKEQPIEEVRAKMKEIVRKRNRDEDESLLDYFKSYGLASPGGSITDQDIQRWIDWLVSQGELKEGQIKPSDLYTNEFNPYVEKTISP